MPEAASSSPQPAPQPFRTAHDLCEAAVNHVLASVNTVQYLIHSIEGITGQPFTRDRIKCLPAVPAEVQERRRRHQALASLPSHTPLSGADAKAAARQASGALVLRPDEVFAGYMWRRARPDCEKGDVVLVEDHLSQMNIAAAEASASRKSSKHAVATVGELLERDYAQALAQTERNLRHELIHAFDDVRGFVESADCTHQACSEVRAARLSGDCFAAEEAKRGRFSIFQGGLQCVRRRATMAVEMSPVCKGFSERAVETVFARCYSDYEPYAAPVYALGSYGDTRFDNGTLRL